MFDNLPSVEEILGLIFPGSGRICCGKRKLREQKGWRIGEECLHGMGDLVPALEKEPHLNIQ